MEWAEVINNPLLKNLPFKIELNKWGKILMSPASNRHGYVQAEVVYQFRTKLPKGKVITECSVNTPEGVKVADVAWASDSFIDGYGFETPYQTAPEICVEIISASNTKQEMVEKIELYLSQGAKEVWICDQKANITFYSSEGEIKKSNICI